MYVFCIVGVLKAFACQFAYKNFVLQNLLFRMFAISSFLSTMTFCIVH